MKLKPFKCVVSDCEDFKKCNAKRAITRPCGRSNTELGNLPSYKKQLRKCQRENVRLFRVISGMCYNEYNDACRHGDNKSRQCTLRNCPLVREARNGK